MEQAEIAKVAVSAAPYPIDKPYDYLVPPEMADTARPGTRVTVPFGRGNRDSQGIVLARTKGEKRPGIKAVRRVLDGEAVLDRAGIDLALWMRGRYFCTVFQAVKTILPAGLWYEFEDLWSLTPQARASDGSLSPKARAVAEVLVRHGGQGGGRLLRSALGDGVEETLKEMKRAGLLHCEQRSRRKIADKSRQMAALSLPAEEALTLMEKKRSRAPVQWEVVCLLAAAGRSAAAEVCYYTGATLRTLRELEKAGIVALSQEEALRIPELTAAETAEPILLSEEQQAAFSQIMADIDTPRPGVTLLQGVTGSGKTQVYLRLVQEILSRGRGAAVLVPEIVLTPQMMRTFSAYFGPRVALLHSGLKMSERYDQWKRIRRGEAAVVLGTRSAIFAPLKDLGLIVLDEEQESSYQSETAPRYDAREVARFLCAKAGAALVLGSATPTVETAWAARQGMCRLARLTKRYHGGALPQVIVADLKEEIRAGNSGLISAPLRRELERNLAAGEQSILFLNRRGSSRYVVCGACGSVPECPRCSVAMTYHSANGRLMCHYCGHSQRAEGLCRDCGGRMKQVGAGTQRVEQQLQAYFPESAVLRMDADTAAGCGHEALLQRFVQERVPILLGTQMVAKGLDFENVTLVGVLSADISLYMDTYRSAERTFSLLTQVVGRAGRRNRTGRAVIQTYTPGSDVIAAAAKQDYDAFYECEIRLRRLRRLPPFADLFTLTVSGLEEGRVLRAAAALRDRLRRLCAQPEIAEAQPEVLGPAPAAVLKVNQRYRYRCTLVGRNDVPTRRMLSGLQQAFARDGANRGLMLLIGHDQGID